MRNSDTVTVRVGRVSSNHLQLLHYGTNTPFRVRVIMDHFTRNDSAAIAQTQDNNLK